MAKERLSKLQRWIITECFKVTVMMDRSGLQDLISCSHKDHWGTCVGARKERSEYGNWIRYKCIRMEKYGHICDQYSFYREEILLSYFNFIRKYSRESWGKAAHFYGDTGNNKAQVTLTRSLRNLYQKGYIVGFRGYKESSIEYLLTDKGRELALKLLGLESSVIVEPELLSEEECDKKKRDNEIQISLIKAQLGVR